MANFRDQIKSYVDKHWFIPCADDTVWVYYGPINTKQEIAEHKKTNAGDWSAVFLNYDDLTYGDLEGLYIVPTADMAKANGGDLKASSFKTRKMIASWYDNKDKNTANPEVLAQKPKYHGLNDCAHFVTQSLDAGGIDVKTTGVSILYNKLVSLSDTKTLARKVSATTADRIIKSGVMKIGDVIIYSTEKSHNHSVVYMGNQKIAMHTWANHPNNKTIQGDWKESASKDHPLVTLIHFGRDDNPIPPDSPFVGWWHVTLKGSDYYYLFHQNGSVNWTTSKPTSLKSPIRDSKGRGYWFASLLSLNICWTETGSLESFNILPFLPTKNMSGRWNNTDDLAAKKMVFP